MTKDLDFIEVTEKGDKKEEEFQCVNKNENVTAVATPTRRSQRNASKIKNATTNKDNNNNVGTTNSQNTTSKTSQEQLPQIPPTPNIRRGPGRPRKSLVIEGLEQQPSTNFSNLNHNNENRESVEASTLSNGSTLRIKFAKVGQVASSSSPFNVTNFTNTPDSSFLNNNNSRGSGLPLSNTFSTPSLISDTVVSSSSPTIIPPPVKRGPGRPRKNPLPPSTILPSSYSVNNNNDTSSSPRQREKKRKVSRNLKNDSYSNELGNKGNKKDHHNPRKKSKTGSNNEESSESSLRKTKLSGSIESKKTPLDELRDMKIKEKEAELANVVDDHDSLIRELYYMESYNLLLNNLDPQTIKQDNSERMVKYLASHNLWSTLNEQVVNSIQLNSTRMSTRHSLTKHRELIVNMLQKSVGSRGFNLVENHHSQFNSLESYLKSFVTLDEEDMTPVEEELRVEKATELQYRIWALKNEGRLNEITKPAPEPSRPKIERDYLLELMTQRAKYMNKFTESKYRITRQIHKAVLQHFSKLANQGPREKKLEEKRIKRLAKTTANLVKQKWKSIESIILQKRDELRKEEQTREGKRHLNLLLEHSTQMLEVQQNELLGAHLTRNQNKIMDTDEKESNSIEIEEESEIIPAISEPPTGTTLSTANVRTQIPPLLRGQLREYQHVGLDWLASLYNNGINGILADEMGLGKTIQTIALLAHIAYEKGDWGPHLIVVPTSVIINWEMEFKKWCPGFIILTYYGNPKERKDKRIGWMKEHTFHVCITSYHLVVLDQVVFKKKKWHYLILDEAHNIKNFQSQRWKTLLNFNSERRLLLTGTPLQNNLMELWSLLYFLMPNGVSGDMPLGFANQKEFQEWFSRPVNKMIENNEQFDEETLSAVQKLHTVLRPYLLRRLKSDVEKQLPAKHHHIIKCRLSKRQRFLYDDFMSRAKTKETLQSGNFLSIINCLMQLRKVCNHPDLFELRPIRTSFAMSKSVLASYESSKHKVCRLISKGNNPLNQVNLEFLNLIPNQFEESSLDCWYGMIENSNINNTVINYNSLSEFGLVMKLRSRLATKQRWEYMRYVNSFRLKCRPIYGRRLINLCRRAGATICDYALFDARNPRKYLDRTEAISDMIVSYDRRYYMMEEIIKQYAFVTPAVVARDMTHHTLVEIPDELRLMVHEQIQDIYHPIRVKLQIAFPDKRLLQYDCGKLQELDILLRRLKDNGHRALIFTQMTRVLDILEIFLNIHGHRYLRLDGATKVEQRQMLTERFNHDPKILVFILSTRSGGLGINLTGADSVIFYDSDWNPCMDRQCQDRFVSEYTIEENMLQKANQKRLLDKMVITDGEFTTDFFQRMDWREIVSDIAPNRAEEVIDEPNSGIELEQCLAEVEDENDVNAAKVAKIEMDLDLTDFADTSETPAESSSAARRANDDDTRS
ncbi:2068_t:CDS:2 [Diversispora eburnea]|uniref:DNA helicase n=1 Tax=Diversispora eburnea TaxID=1213867 RepID=A0A9N9A2Y3_9GLOM|nr:2068_t:CDS:2 [Diversispora eburnea]